MRLLPRARDVAVLLFAGTVLSGWIVTVQSVAAADAVSDAKQSSGEQLDSIIHGGPDEAARALIALVPNSSALPLHYEELMGAVGRCQGTISLGLLQRACDGYHGWRVASVLDNGDRRVAILQWISEKIWESPSASGKQQLVDQFVQDVEQQIQHGSIPPMPALSLVTHAAFVPEVAPDVSTKTIQAFLVHMMDQSAGELKGQAWGLLFDLGRYLELGTIDKAELCALLKKAYPEKSFAKEPEDFFHPVGLVRVRTMTRADYDSIPGMSLDALRERLEKEACCTNRSSTLFCTLAIRRLLAEYETDPQGVTTRLVSLVESGKNVYEILSFLDVKALDAGIKQDPSSPFVPLPVLYAILDVCEKRLDGPPTMDFEVLAGELTSFLVRLAKEHAAGRNDLAEHLERRCTDLLLKACQAEVRWRASRQRSEYGYLAPFEALKASMPNLPSATKDRVRECLRNLPKSQDYDRLSIKNKERIEKICGEITALK